MDNNTPDKKTMERIRQERADKMARGTVINKNNHEKTKDSKL